MAFAVADETLQLTVELADAGLSSVIRKVLSLVPALPSARSALTLTTLAFAACTIFVTDPSLGFSIWLLGLWMAAVGACVLWGDLRSRDQESLDLGGLATVPRSTGIMWVLGGIAVVMIPSTAEMLALVASVVLFMVGLPAAYVAFLFVSYLLYSALYQWGTRRFGAPVSTVVVLGSGLGGGERVTPLLACRLERGRAVFDRSVEAGTGPILIASGGRGTDEKLSEAEAMSRWLLERGFPPDSLVREDLSTDTEENLANSAGLMRQWSAKGDVAVATSDYHAFRSEIIMRKAGIPGYTVGCRTARYYWPSATVREFVAILLEHSRLNLAIIALLAIPLVMGVVSLLA